MAVSVIIPEKPRYTPTGRINVCFAARKQEFAALPQPNKMTIIINFSCQYGL